MQPDVKEPEIPETFTAKAKKSMELVVYIIKFILYLMVSVAVSVSTIKSIAKEWKEPKTQNTLIEIED